ncbi:hypothetical protein [Streptomyces tailanensis]|uniref:hypothetical protein n=1 Tax=Streptomyces tailanensis TaxID=2569858 RepID=UPI001C0EC18E|nr:hypothetical protein [Streptomyces tailanensis]
MTSPQTQQAPQTEQAQPESERQQSAEHHAYDKVVHLHTAHPRVPIPYVTPGDLFTGVRKGMARSGQQGMARLPSPRKLAFYGALGGMAAAQIIEWPIALAVGAATEVITREQAAQRRSAEQEQGQREQGADEASARTEQPAGMVPPTAQTATS